MKKSNFAMSKDKKRIYKPKSISGFPEWLPEFRAVELQWLDKIRAVFESYGFCSIETPSVEELDVIAAKGEDVDKEIYVLERLHKEENDKDARLALHFDQTVPLARYVAQHFGDLTFPFKRYQMQKVWRGERPQVGRMREFYQCDIDVINVDNLPIHFDAEVAAICYEALASLDIGRVQLRISNRKILSGLLSAYGLEEQEQQAHVFRVIDKIEKLNPEEFESQLTESLKPYDYNGVNPLGDVKAVLAYQKLLSEMTAAEQVNFLEELIVALNETKWIEFEKKYDLEKIHYFYDDFGQGFVELYDVMKTLSHLPTEAVTIDLTIVRGLDYYTGTVYETQLLDVPEFTGSVCSGGRYDDLAGNYINKHLPGVGISIGFSRLFDVLRQAGKIEAGPKSPAQVLVILPSEDRRSAASDAARALRSRGMNVELYHAPQKIGKQMGYAEKKSIPYVWFPPFEDGQDHEVKNMETGDQSKADPKDWNA